MARTRKLSRIRGLNQYELKNLKEAAPFYKSSTFDDSKTIIYFDSASVNYPTTLPLSAKNITSELTTSITIPGRSIFGAETQLWYTQSTDSIRPFVDTLNIPFSGSYYLTGSDLPGFKQPLRDKTKIEVLLPLANTSTLKSNLVDDSPFGYYNFANQSFNSVGIGSNALDLFSGSLTINDYFTNKAIGFGPSIRDITSAENKYNSTNVYTNLGLPISEFGFPSSNTYAANSSSYLELKNYISKPFLLEKVEVEIGSMQLSIPDNLILDSTSVAVSTFFILNQRVSESFVRTGTYNYFQFFDVVSDFPSIPNTSYTNSSLPYFKTGNQIIDLVSFGRIATVAKNTATKALVSESVEYYISNQSLSPTKEISYTVTGSKLNLLTNQSSKNVNPIYSMFFMDNVAGTNRVFSQKLTTLNGTRSGVEDYSSRNYIKQLVGGNSILTSFIRNAYGPNEEMPVVYNTNPVENAPYILFPEDKLIFGFQVPIFDRINLVSDTDLIANSVNFWKEGENASPGVSVVLSKNIKVILYGSYIKMNEYSDYEEYHEYESRTQLNTNATINIGEKQ